MPHSPWGVSLVIESGPGPPTFASSPKPPSSLSAPAPPSRRSLPSLALSEYATYARTRSACERAVERLPNRQRQVVQGHYFDAMTQPELAARHGLADSTIRNTHAGALRNLRRDDELFDVLEAVGKVRDLARRLELEAQRRAA